MCRSSTLAVLADSGPFRGLLLTILGPKRFPRLTNPGVRLRVGHQHSWFLSILVRFMHYYLPFLGPRVISTIEDPRGAFTCPASTLTVLADSGPFRGLLLTILGSEVISIVDEPLVAVMCRSSTLAVLADSGPFRGLLLTILGSEVISTINEP